MGRREAKQMEQVQKILFPIDFIEKYETLLPWVSVFVKKFDATLYVLYVTQDLSDFASFYVPHGNIQTFREESMKAAQEKMQAIVRESFKGFTKIETRIAIGSPADKILEVADKEGINLIIMSTHGRRGLERTIFGSVCDKVLRTSKIPVLTIPPGKG